MKTDMNPLTETALPNSAMPLSNSMIERHARRDVGTSERPFPTAAEETAMTACTIDIIKARASAEDTVFRSAYLHLPKGVEAIRANSPESVSPAKLWEDTSAIIRTVIATQLADSSSGILSTSAYAPPKIVAATMMRRRGGRRVFIRSLLNSQARSIG